MVQKVKDRIVGSLIMVATGIVVSGFSVWYANSKTDAKELQEKIDNKLDKSEYESDQNFRWDEHDKIHVIQSKTIEGMNDKIDWLYKNEISKNNYRIAPLKQN